MVLMTWQCYPELTLVGVQGSFLKSTASGADLEHIDLAVFNSCGLGAQYYSSLSSPERSQCLVYSRILLSHKRNKCEWVELIWMSLEPVIHSEVSQKEKNKYYILTHIYEI